LPERKEKDSVTSKALPFLFLCTLLSGCASVVPLSSLLSTPTGATPLQVHDETQVQLTQDDFVLVKTNVLGRSRGFSLLGLITIYPATLTKAMSQLYARESPRLWPTW
jgi:hypothetical protein